MSSEIGFVEYVCSQISGAGIATYKKMFGEYGVYLNGKIIGLICDDQFFLKITDAGRKFIRESIEAPAYPGSKPFFLIEDLEDRDYLSALISATYNELPEPQLKIKKSAESKIAARKNSLTSLPNIGVKIHKQLCEVGIDTIERLRATGSRETWLLIKAIDPSACIMRLYSLEGAIQGIPYTDLDKKIKRELIEFYNSHK